MALDLLIKALIAIAPVFALLIAFDRLDVFNLISFRVISALLGVGAGIAVISLFANGGLLEGFPIGTGDYSRYVAPIVEETLKAAPIVAMFHRNRIGFKIDAAIAGFALGAGFSILENLWFVFTIADANVSAWLVRGFGTAIMHGSTTALFAIIAHEMTERQAAGAADLYKFNPLLFLPGLALAIIIHASFNHFGEQPLLVMVLTLLLAPLTLFLALARSATATNEWLKADESAHRELLADIRSGRFDESDKGRALVQALARLDENLTPDARAYIELKLELVLRAEELISASHQGAGAGVTSDDRQKFAQLDMLTRRLGRPIVEALTSRMGLSRNDLWEFSRLRAHILMR
jgi:RsiW-degrading membrane proteinase PrsW (M82 family)